MLDWCSEDGSVPGLGDLVVTFLFIESFVYGVTLCHALESPLCALAVIGVF